MHNYLRVRIHPLRQFRNRQNQRYQLKQRGSKPAWQSITLSALLLFPIAVVADALPDHDNGPLTGLFGFPESTEGGRIVNRGEHVWST